MQQNMIEWLVAKARGVNENAKIILSFFLPYIFIYCSRPEAPSPTSSGKCEDVVTTGVSSRPSEKFMLIYCSLT